MVFQRSTLPNSNAFRTVQQDLCSEETSVAVQVSFLRHYTGCPSKHALNTRSLHSASNVCPLIQMKPPHTFPLFSTHTTPPDHSDPKMLIFFLSQDSLLNHVDIGLSLFLAQLSGTLSPSHSARSSLSALSRNT